MEQVYESWKYVCGRLGCKNREDETFGYISLMYLVPERFYHTLEFHIAKCLVEIKNVLSLSENPLVLIYSAILHDIYMDFIGGLNEKNSAEFARLLAIKMGLGEEFGQKAFNTIALGTDHSQDISRANIDIQLLNNCDLAILGKPEQEYDLYDYLVTREYTRFYPQEKFKIGRSAVLEKFRQRDPIFSLEIFRGKYEDQAKKNLTRSIEKLRS